MTGLRADDHAFRFALQELEVVHSRLLDLPYNLAAACNLWGHSYTSARQDYLAYMAVIRGNRLVGGK